MTICHGLRLQLKLPRNNKRTNVRLLFRFDMLLWNNKRTFVRLLFRRKR